MSMNAMVRAAVGMAVMLTLVGVASSPASASEGITSTCYGSTCNGLRPENTTCASDAYTAKTAYLYGRVIELRYSPSCRATWGRIRNGSVGDGVDVMNDYGNYYYAEITSGSDNHTRMVNDKGITASSCGFVGYDVACTDSY